MKTVFADFSEFAARVMELLKEAQDASCEGDRVIAVSKLSAAATDCVADMAPDRDSVLGKILTESKAKKKPKRPAKSKAVKQDQLF